ncbi:MAG: hypothetical protein COB20_14330 [SAR86 cluster bacterium]|uniref:Uncharacterized protein n=1 Tax=SAR86 cluster bacterium TaxID=2030880 RepID=A0A2A4WX05_9GAMM|nr:MAG: hypothetical protein COB20_14330 [SAR86 cluster bacterium]
MKNILAVLILAATLVGCESMYEDGGIPRIRSQKQVDAYNATVSSEGEKLVCTKERPLGSNISQFYCMTLNQRDRIAMQSQQVILDVGRGAN